MKKLVGILTAFMLLLVACGNDVDTGSSDGGDSLEMKYPVEVSNGGTAVPEARLQYGLASDTPFAGILHPMWYEGNPDSVVMSFMWENLYLASENRTFIEGQDGENIAWYEMNDDLTVKTIHIKEGVTWHDGDDFNVDDIIMSYNMLAHPDYTGVRFGEPHTFIVGINDVKAGTATEIAGLNRIDDMTLEITYDQANDQAKYAQEYYVASHLLEGADVATMTQHDTVRTNPVGIGPFKVATIVPGEAVKFDAFEDYHLGAPKIAGVDLKVISPNVIDEAFKSGDIDMVDSYPAATFDESNLGSNTSVLQQVAGSYSYLGFKLGTWDKEASAVATDPTMKMSDIELRKAMGYSMNNTEVGAALYDGLRMRADSIIIPLFTDYYNPDLGNYNYDPEKAEQILDDAGYLDVDGDGFRENPEGEQLVINMAHMSGAGAETLSQYYIDKWHEVGLNVQLTGGRLMEFNSFYERVGDDDPEIDIYFGAWSTGYNPNPSGLYGEFAQFNFTRYIDDELRAIMDGINSDEAKFDEAVMKDYYDQWQKAAFEKSHVIPTLFRSIVYPVNNRVVNYDLKLGSTGLRLHEIELSASSPIKDGE